MGKIRLVKQKTDYTCGPAALAMIARSTESKILKLLGSKFYYGVDPKDMRWALSKLDITHSEWQRDGLWMWDKIALLHWEYFFDSKKRDFRIRKYPVYGHYIVYANKKYYDPGDGVRNELFHFKYSRDWTRVLGYITIFD